MPTILKGKEKLHWDSKKTKNKKKVKQHVSQPRKKGSWHHHNIARSSQDKEQPSQRQAVIRPGIISALNS